MCFENVPCKAFYSGKNGVWNGSQTMWDSFQTSAIIKENLHFPYFWNPSYVRRNVLVYTYFGPHTQAIDYIRGPVATLVFYFEKEIFAYLKGYIFHLNTL